MKTTTRREQNYRRNKLAPKRHTRRRLFIEKLENRQLLAGLVGYWAAENNALDTAGAAQVNNGTLINGATFAQGKVGQAFSFDGLDDRVLIADSPNSSLALTNSISIEAWIKINAFPTTAQGTASIVFRGDSRGGWDPYVLSLDPGGYMHFKITSPSNFTTILTAPVTTGEFIHVAATLDGGTGAMKIYENGTLVAQTTTIARPFGALDPSLNPGIGIGNANSTYNVPLNGLIDELKIYEVALSSTQVLADYNAPGSNTLPSISVNDAATIEGDTHFGSGQINLVNSDPNSSLRGSRGMAIGPDAYLYVSSYLSNEVLKYNAATGAFLGALVTNGRGGLSGANSLAFRPDVNLSYNLYVLSTGNSSVLRYDANGDPKGISGALGDAVFIASGINGLKNPNGMTFGPDGKLYISSSDTNQILRYNSDASFDGAFVAAGSGGLSSPGKLTFGPDGNLYVSSTATNSVLRYHGPTGAYIDTFIPSASGGLYNPGDMLFNSGSLYVVSQRTDQILRYDEISGAFLDAVDPANSNGVERPTGLLLANGNLLVGSYAAINSYGPVSGERITVKLSSPRPETISVNYATADVTAFAASDYTTTPGTLTFAPGEIIKSFLVPTTNDTFFEGNETFIVNLSNPISATIVRGQGVTTIIDNDIPATKFYVVNDGSPDRTFEYSSAGAATENYSINSGNVAPRGAASTAAGDKVWVVDANRNVYVYYNNGALLGSWAAGGISPSAQIEGITTDGIDIWLVDNKSDKVYRYSGAASLLSGSQSASSSFSLNSSNTSPKDLVTDGISIWVVNDSTTDKVFKYTAFDNIPVPGKPAGTLQGSWTISTTSPTGITLDPTNPASPLWVVDNANDSVYQFAQPTPSSSSLSTSGLFALAAGNTNPQGIADPPVGIGSHIVSAAMAPLTMPKAIDTDRKSVV